MITLNKMKIRAMKIVLTLQFDVFPGKGNTKTIYCTSLPNYLHAVAAISRLPQWQGNTASLAIYGMLVEDCFSLTKFNTMNVAFYNQVNIYADYIEVDQESDGGYDQVKVQAACDKLPLIYMGQVINAGVDFNNPDRPFVIQSNVTVQSLAVVTDSTSVNDTANLTTVVNSMIATYNATKPQIKYQLKAVLPEQIVTNTHLVGSFASQLQELCSNYDYQIRTEFSEDNIQLLTLTKVGTSITSQAQPLNVDSGMLGFPVTISFGVAAKEWFNPFRGVNDLVDLQSYYTPLNGQYYVWQQQIVLQTQGELWESSLTLYGFNNSEFAGFQ